MRIDKERITSFKNKLWIAGVALLLSSCFEAGTVYHQHQTLPDNLWGRGDTLCFKLGKLESGHTYKLTVEGRFQKSYPYQQLEVLLKNGSQNATPIIIRVTEKDSHQQGVFLSSVSSMPIPFKADKDSLTLKVIHHMQRENLPGINDLGILLQY